MTIDVKKLVAALNPDVFCKSNLKSEVKKIAKEQGILKAAELAELRETEYLDVILTQNTIGAAKLSGIKYPIEQHKLIYDDFSQNLEPVYFWILDYANKEYGNADKLTDNFISSPGSGQFAEMSRRMTVLQEEGMKIFAAVNTVLRSILNIIYDLKEFKIRIDEYDRYRSSDPGIKRAATLALKQIRIDKVDINRGNGSINGLAQQLDFVTIRDAFLVCESPENVNDLDLNDRVKRILQQRVPEFFKWAEESEKELKKRFEIEKIYLKSQVNSIKLYSHWLKPYLKATKQLEQNARETADLVNYFNTSLFELSLLAKGRYDPENDIYKRELPEFFRKLKEKKQIRNYIPMTLVEFSYRVAPDRTDQRGGFGYRGRFELLFTSFALNDDELEVLKREMEKDDFADVYKAITGSTDESLGQIQTDIDKLLGEEEEKKEEEKSEDINPFSALKSLFKNEKKDENVDLKKEGLPKEDTQYEKVIRSQALLNARFSCRKFYDAYKKYLGMNAFDPSAF